MCLPFPCSIVSSPYKNINYWKGALTWIRNWWLFLSEGKKQQLKKHWILWFVVQTTNFVSYVFNKSSLLVVIIVFMLDVASASTDHSTIPRKGHVTVHQLGLVEWIMINYSANKHLHLLLYASCSFFKHLVWHDHCYNTQCTGVFLLQYVHRCYHGVFVCDVKREWGAQKEWKHNACNIKILILILLWPWLNY